MNDTFKYNVAEPDIGDLEREYLIRAYDSGWISSLGEFINHFESEFARFTNCKYAVSVSNGTVALQLALKAMNIKEGDEVILPSFTFVATAASIVHCGAIPVFVDSSPETGTMSPSLFKKAITLKTKAVIPVHIYGHPADMEQINSIAKKNNIVVIEDAAEAHGAMYKGEKVGGLGDMATFSFYGNKLMTTGEGGIVTTNNRTFYEKLKFLRDHAMSKTKRYWHTEVGFNFRMTNLQAAIGCAQLLRFSEILSTKNKILDNYRNILSDFSDQISLNLKLPWADPVPWLICCSLKIANRDAVMQQLSNEGIDSRPYFIPLHKMPPYKRYKFFYEESIVCNDISKSGFNLPSSSNLTYEDIMYICKKLKKILNI